MIKNLLNLVIAYVSIDKYEKLKLFEIVKYDVYLKLSDIKISYITCCRLQYEYLIYHMIKTSEKQTKKKYCRNLSSSYWLFKHKRWDIINFLRKQHCWNYVQCQHNRINEGIKLGNLNILSD